MILTVPSSCVVETPQKLAEAIVKAISIEDGCWIDPCAGAGVFLDAIQKLCKPDLVHAIDITKHPRRYSEIEHIGDFLEFHCTQGKADAIVANPPYIPISRLDSKLKARALSTRFEDMTVSGSSSYWMAFLIHSLKLLKPGGVIGFVLPAAYDYADYAQVIREQIPRLFRRFEVHRSLSPLFSSVSDGCIVILGFGFFEEHREEHRYEHRNLDELCSSLENVRLSPESKKSKIEEHPKVMGDMFDVHIGAVTGDAKYFILTEEERQAHHIDLRDCVPVLSKSSHVRSHLLKSVNLEILNSRARDKHWLFSPAEGELEQVASSRYVNYGKDGGCNLESFKIRNREPWFQVPYPEVPEIAFTGMFTLIPSVCFLKDEITVTNTLYCLKSKKKLTLPKLKALTLSFYTSACIECIAKTARRYPDGLLKLEPSQVRKLPYVELDESRINASVLKAVRRMLKKGDLKGCGAFVDSLAKGQPFRGQNQNSERNTLTFEIEYPNSPAAPVFSSINGAQSS